MKYGMMLRQRRVFQKLIAVALIAAAAIWGIESISTKILTAHYATVRPLVVTPVSSAANDGNQLAHVNGCFGCHGDHLTGRVVFNSLFGTRIVASNLTRLAHQETDAQLTTAIRYGIKHDGTSVIEMPSTEFVRSSDSDVAAIIAYMRSLPERPDAASKTRWRFDGRALLAMGILPSEAAMVNTSALGPPQTPESPLARGRYITEAHCSGCHGPDLSGKTIEGSPDLRLSIEHYSPTAFAHFFSTGEGQIGHGTKTMTKMIRGRFKYFAAADVHSIYIYLRSLDQPI